MTPLGADLDAFWSGLVTGSDGISMIERFPVDDLRVGRGGEIKKLRPVLHAHHAGCRATQLLLAAAQDLLARAAIAAAPERVAIVLGTALGGVDQLERALARGGHPRHAAGALYDSPACALARRLDARGPVLTVATACAAGGDGARHRRGPAARRRRRRGDRRRIRRSVSIRDARFRRAALAHAGARASVRPPPQRAPAGRGRRRWC